MPKAQYWTGLDVEYRLGKPIEQSAAQGERPLFVNGQKVGYVRRVTTAQHGQRWEFLGLLGLPAARLFHSVPEIIWDLAPGLDFEEGESRYETDATGFRGGAGS